MRRDLALSVFTGLRIFDMANLEDLTLPFSVEVVSELIYTGNVELAAEGIDEAIRFNLIPCVVVITHIHEAWLSHLKVLRKSLSLHEESKVIATIVRMVYLSDLDSVICQEVVDDEWEIIEASVETKDSAIVIKELLLALNTATAK